MVVYVIALKRDKTTKYFVSGGRNHRRNKGKVAQVRERTLRGASKENY